MSDLEEDLKKQKNRVRWKTIRYLERNCDVEKKCQICGSTNNIQIHHLDYDDFLKINFLCIKHHNEVHHNNLMPPEPLELKPKIKKETKQDKICNAFSCKIQMDFLTKIKAEYLLNEKGISLTDAVRETLAEYAKEFDKKYGKED